MQRSTHNTWSVFDSITTMSSSSNKPWDLKCAQKILLDKLHEAIEYEISHHICLEKMMNFIEKRILPFYSKKDKLLEVIEEHYPGLFVNFFLNRNNHKDNKEGTNFEREIFKGGIPNNSGIHTVESDNHADNTDCSDKEDEDHSEGTATGNGFLRSLFENDTHLFYIDSDVITMYHVPRLLVHYYQNPNYSNGPQESIGHARVSIKRVL